MPDNKSKIKFNAEYLKSIEVLITNCRTMYNKINPKIKHLRMADLIRAITTLQAIKDYAAFNGAKIPRKPYGMITHDASGHRILAKGALAVRELREAAPAAHRKLAAKPLDCIIVFESQLPR